MACHTVYIGLGSSSPQLQTLLRSSHKLAPKPCESQAPVRHRKAPRLGTELPQLTFLCSRVSDRLGKKGCSVHCGGKAYSIQQRLGTPEPARLLLSVRSSCPFLVTHPRHSVPHIQKSPHSSVNPDGNILRQTWVYFQRQS